jgi:hypothetical protein
LAKPGATKRSRATERSDAAKAIAPTAASNGAPAPLAEQASTTMVPITPT